MRKLLVSDYDGTLRRNGIVSAIDLAAIHSFRQEGNLFVIATGRSLGMLWNELELFAIECDGIIANNGGIITTSQKELIKRTDIDFADAQALVSLLEQYPDYMIGISDGDRFGNLQDGVHEEKSSHQPLLGVTMTSSALLWQEQVINSFYLRARTKAKTWQLYKYLLSSNLKGLAFHYNNGTIDVSALNVSKKTAAEAFAKHMQIPKDGIYTIGDGHNDWQMIESFYGFAMEPGAKEVQKAAKHKVNSVAACLAIINKL